MNPILSILRAAHCRSTHHYFAVDALTLVQTDAGRRLTSQLLRHHDRYLTGAKDPDIRFRDFQNHVVHVTDGYWGGAPRVAHMWYDRMQRYLRSDRFGDAAHAAGVLSHYFTDPLQPLHTEQCEQEKVLHRPIEWSITKSYQSIYRRWKEDDLRVVFQLSGGPGWLGEAILHGARFANHKYASLLNQYDLDQGAKDPASGLNSELRESLAELFGLAITGLARVLERAAADAEATRRAPLPTAGLALPLLLATMRVPWRLWIKRIEDKSEQLAVEKLVEEFQRTGSLVANLPAEVDIVHRVTNVYHDEKVWKQDRLARLASKSTVVDVTSADDQPTAPQEEPVILKFPDPRDQTQTERSNSAQTPTPSLSIGSLSRRDPLVEAPSIGPKTAAKFALISIQTVGEFLDADVDDVARRLATYWITAETVSQWRNQSMLMCQIPGLRCRDAQLLAGAGFESAQALAATTRTTIFRRVSEFATTTSGRRYLRGALAPTKNDIVSWLENAAGEGATDEPRRQSA
jgi:hypothetical protein